MNYVSSNETREGIIIKIGLIGDSLTEGRPGVSFATILQKKYSSISFVNLGKPGETVKSLYSRLTKTKLDMDYDVLFLRIGVNDVYTKLLKVKAQPIAEDHQEFSDYFIKVLDIVIPAAKHIVIVSPAIVGENLSNSSNCEIKSLSALIESISMKHEHITFLHMQSVFEKHLTQVTSSEYISTSIFTVMKDVLFYKSQTSIDRLSRKRGLHLTLDGIHLNSRGAMLVAKKYSVLINHYKQ
ncbi:SGNH/GDSL hydrolase family protein [Metabacillus malikii]|uniref:Lysophospholipase L1-like esterase n=1 Tax=Metabacillus malikii TaxID=1504265 RepID=A0ABT9ZN29_9BACI|nr:GDSL-type esterase/lipase family protein [Metabacillus malikii]MDQ0233329.1 lysophospholipase L1-like esterase [Metabacillus malikii]